MSDYHLAAEKVDIYDMFQEMAEGLEVELDAEEMWLFDDCEAAVNDVVEDVTETYKLGALTTDYYHIKVIAAIAFCDTAEFTVIDYVGAGGEKYEDD